MFVVPLISLGTPRIGLSSTMAALGYAAKCMTISGLYSNTFKHAF